MTGMLRKRLRQTLPPSLRLAIAQLRRAARDRVSGLSNMMVAAPNRPADLAGLHEIVAVAQPIRRTAHWEGKLNNLRVAAERLDGIAVPPGGVLSFWCAVGRPDACNGFLTGRSIRSDRVAADVGGGLCQISGLAYELGLRAGMAVVERHPHTRDLYTEATRFTPLGLDATVVWGHKDLRLRNDTGQALAFAFAVDDHMICGRVLSAVAANPSQIRIEPENGPPTHRRVRVLRRKPGADEDALVSCDSYAKVDPEHRAA